MVYQVPTRSIEMNGAREQNTDGERELPFSVVQALFMEVIFVVYGWSTKFGHYDFIIYLSWILSFSVK